MSADTATGAPLLKRAISIGRALVLAALSAAVGILAATVLQWILETARVDFASLPLSPLLREMIETVMQDYLKSLFGIGGAAVRLKAGFRDAMVAIACAFALGLGIGLALRIPVPEVRTVMVAAAVVFAIGIVLGALWLAGEVIARNVDWHQHLVFVPGYPDLDEDRGPYDEVSATLDWVGDLFGRKDE